VGDGQPTAIGRIVGHMRTVLTVLAVWAALDLALACVWVAVAARCRRAGIRAMVRAAELYANPPRRASEAPRSELSLHQ
jgi:hypothetical protein